ncbi:MAG: cytochrome c, partial [Verrucomicrobiota bacterium]
WDTTECRMLYAWRGGFLDMTRYWGNPESGRRKSFGYVPTLVGEVIYLTEGSHPLGLFDTYTSDTKPTFKSYRLVDGVPEFSYTVGEATVQVRIEPGANPMEILKRYTIEGAEGFGYTEAGYQFSKESTGPTSFTVTLKGKPLSLSNNTEEEVTYSTEKPNAEWGQALYTNLGCFACHTQDGAKGHGPSFAGIYGAERPITGLDAPVIADAAYLEESILNPMAKVVDPYPSGYMPPYPINKKEIRSLILFIETLANE